MGVVYRLTEEVIFFIVNEKKDKPDISCRELALLTGQKFDIPVSKSSINAILKKSALSSSIGRRKESETIKAKFIIPEHKKRQLSNDFLKIAENKEIGFADNKKEEILKHNQLDENRPSSGKEESKNENELQVTLKEPILKSTNIINPTDLIDGMGYAFFKAYFVQLFTKAFFNDVQKKYGQFLPQNFDQIFEILSCLTLLEEGDSQNIRNYENHAFWKINGIPASQKIWPINDWLKEGSWLKSFCLETAFYQESLSMKASGFRFTLIDGEFFTIDSSLFSFFSNNISPVFFMPVNAAILNLFQYIILNESSLSLHLTDFVLNNQEVINLIAFFEGKEDKKIKKIQVLDHEFKEITNFPFIPEKKRTYSVSIGPSQEIFNKLIKPVKWVSRRQFYSYWLDRDVWYVELKTSIFANYLGEKNDIQMLVVWINEHEIPQLVILTNRNEEAESVIFDSLIKWPYLKDKQAMAAVGKEDKLPDKLGWNTNFKDLTIKRILYQVGQSVEKYIKNQLEIRGQVLDCSISVLQYLYKLKGRMFYNRDSLNFEIFVNKSDSNYKGLQALAEAINLQNISIQFNVRMIVKIVIY